MKRHQAQTIDDWDQEPKDDNLGAERVKADAVTIDGQQAYEDTDRIGPRIAKEQAPGEVERERDAEADRENHQERPQVLGRVEQQKHGSQK